MISNAGSVESCDGQRLPALVSSMLSISFEWWQNFPDKKLAPLCLNSYSIFYYASISQICRGHHALPSVCFLGCPHTQCYGWVIFFFFKQDFTKVWKSEKLKYKHGYKRIQIQRQSVKDKTESVWRYENFMHWLTTSDQPDTPLSGLALLHAVLCYIVTMLHAVLCYIVTLLHAVLCPTIP